MSICGKQPSPAEVTGEVNRHHSTPTKPDSAIGLSLGEIKAEAFDQDVGINDRQQSFSAELLRLALLGVGAVGYVAGRSLSAPGPSGDAVAIGTAAKWLVLIAAASFGLSAGSALSLRYVSSDLLALQLRIVRLRMRGAPNDPTVADTEEMRRNRRLKATRPLLIASSGCLALGASLFIVFLFLILGR